MTRHLNLLSMQEDLWILAQAVIALILGGLIGVERELTGRGAGFRTHMLVCLAALLFIRISQFLILDAQVRYGNEILRIDPVRMLEAVMAGIAFIGAGTVFRDPDRNIMHGLTTAASLLVVVPIGVAVALDRYTLAVGGTALVLFVLHLMGRFAVAIELKDAEQASPKRSQDAD